MYRVREGGDTEGAGHSFGFSKYLTSIGNICPNYSQIIARLKGLNAFFDIANSNPFRALSVDRMHSGSHGLGGKHIWPEIQEYIGACGRGSMREVDKW